MNLQSEIQYFGELPPPNQARLLALVLYELSGEARSLSTASADLTGDIARFRFVNELVMRLTRYIDQVLADDSSRPSEEVMLRMLLAPRTDKTAERLVLGAYRRAMQGFDHNDTTVTMMPR